MYVRESAVFVLSERLTLKTGHVPAFESGRLPESADGTDPGKFS